MATGLIALLDDVAAIAKLAATTVDDALGQAAKAGTKAAGIVIDDAAVAPGYVVGISPKRELPMIWKITVGSLRNKAVLLPLMLALGYIAPWAITPLLMVGGVYLSYEGAEKVLEFFFPHGAEKHVTEAVCVSDPDVMEKDKVTGAVRTDFILSAEIMAITLSTVQDAALTTQFIVLLTVGIAITLGVYGVVGMLVKMDDIGLAMARNRLGSNTIRNLSAAVGRTIVKGMPFFMTGLSTVGTLAMLWVGGSILTHGLAAVGHPFFEHAIHELSVHVTSIAGTTGTAALMWAVTTFCQGVIGLVVGGAAIPVMTMLVSPMVRLVAKKPRQG